MAAFSVAPAAPCVRLPENDETRRVGRFAQQACAAGPVRALRVSVSRDADRSLRRIAALLHALRPARPMAGSVTWPDSGPADSVHRRLIGRSEERRVGKEG